MGLNYFYNEPKIMPPYLILIRKGSIYRMYKAVTHVSYHIVIRYVLFSLTIRKFTAFSSLIVIVNEEISFLNTNEKTSEKAK